MADIVVVGAGPAGCVFAIRMAQLGHRTTLVERAIFPRRRLGESLSPGVLPLLEAVGARRAVENADFAPAPAVRVDWGEGLRLRASAQAPGLLVDRGRFDAILLARAKFAGVRVLQPAIARHARRIDGRWRIPVAVDGREETIAADFLATASGRGSSAHAHRAPVRTIALFAYWRGGDLPETPIIEAGEDAWFWGVPLPDGAYNTLAFVDPRRFRELPGTLDERFRSLLARSRLAVDCADLTREGSVGAIDATPCLAATPATLDSILLGDAAMTIDPISSSGVQKALQGALAGAIVAHTILTKPERANAAQAFHRDSLRGASERHARWAAGHYATIARQRPSAFWTKRSAGHVELAEHPNIGLDPARLSDPVEVSRDAGFVDAPCLDGDFVRVARALAHPSLEEPIVFVGDREIAPLLRNMPSGLTPLQIVGLWTCAMPHATAMSIVKWTIAKGILVFQ